MSQEYKVYKGYNSKYKCSVIDLRVSECWVQSTRPRKENIQHKTPNCIALLRLRYKFVTAFCFSYFFLVAFLKAYWVVFYLFSIFTVLVCELADRSCKIGRLSSHANIFVLWYYELQTLFFKLLRNVMELTSVIRICKYIVVVDTMHLTVKFLLF